MGRGISRQLVSVQTVWRCGTDIGVRVAIDVVLCRFLEQLPPFAVGAFRATADSANEDKTLVIQHPVDHAVVAHAQAVDVGSQLFDAVEGRGVFARDWMAAITRSRSRRGRRSISRSTRRPVFSTWYLLLTALQFNDEFFERTSLSGPVLCQSPIHPVEVLQVLQTIQ